MLILARLLSYARHGRVHPLGIGLQVHSALLLSCILHVHVVVVMLRLGRLHRDLIVDELRCLSSMQSWCCRSACWEDLTLLGLLQSTN